MGLNTSPSLSPLTDGYHKCPIGGNLEILVRVRSIEVMLHHESVSNIKVITVDSIDMQDKEHLYSAPFPLQDAFFLVTLYLAPVDSMHLALKVA
jgi:hypothetical protein